MDPAHSATNGEVTGSSPVGITIHIDSCIFSDMHERGAIKIAIKEILQKSLVAENDVDWDLYELMNEVKMELMSAFHRDMMNEKPDESEGRPLKARQEWNVVDFSMLKRQWEEYMKWGKVLPRYEKTIESIERTITENILKVTINTELSGHERVSPKDEWMEFFDGMEQSEKERMAAYMDEHFGDWILDGGQWRISDYGLKPLHKLLAQLRKEIDPSKKLPILDKILNVVHQRSDIASWFVEGGSSALSQLSGME